MPRDPQRGHRNRLSSRDNENARPRVHTSVSISRSAPIGALAAELRRRAILAAVRTPRDGAPAEAKGLANYLHSQVLAPLG